MKKNPPINPTTKTQIRINRFGWIHLYYCRLTCMIEFDLEFIWYKRFGQSSVFWLPAYNWVFMANRLDLVELLVPE
jgi:hypothetical protein